MYDAYKEPKYFNIIKRTEFWIKVKLCEDLSKLSDAFITYDKLKEQYSGNYYYDNRCYDKALIRSVMREWIDEMNPTALSSTKAPLKAQALMYEVDSYTINQIIEKPYRVVGDRLVNNHNLQQREREREEEKREKADKLAKLKEAAPYEREQEVRSYDGWMLRRGIINVLRRKYHIEVRFNTYSDVNGLHAAKRLCNWIEVARELRFILPKKQHREDLKFMKQLWSNPDITIGANQNEYPTINQ